MKILFKPQFERDLKKTKDQALLGRLEEAIEEIESAVTLGDIPNIKKLKGHDSAYRIRVGRYRIGLYCDGNHVELVHFLHRKVILSQVSAQIMMSMQQVHLRINDAATGKPTPVRLRITDASGVYYAPFGRLTEFATGVNQDVGGNVQIGAKKWCYIDGACEILLPPGRLQVEITKGFEYKPIDEEITLIPGKMSLRFTIERWCDMRKEGWYSGDTRVHYMSPDAALLEGQAEDVAVVNLLATETTNGAMPNLLSYSGQVFGRECSTCGVAVNTMNRHRYHGALSLLHCHRVVYPLQLGDEKQGDDQSMADWCDQCHRKKGLVIWSDKPSSPDLLYGEPLADLILGKIDAVERMSFANPLGDALAADYWDLLDAGLVVPIVAGSGKISNAQALGAMRTYAHVGTQTPLTYTNWIETVRAGRTFITNGPLLEFTVNDQVPSSTHAIEPNCPIRVRASVRSFDKIDWLSIATSHHGILKVVRAYGGHPWVAEIEHELNLNERGWFNITVIGETRQESDFPYAQSSPFVIGGSVTGGWPHQSKVEKLTEALDATRRWAKISARCSTELHRERYCRVLEEARTALAKKLSNS